MSSFEGPVRPLPRAVTRAEAVQGIRALALLLESGRLGEREAIVAADTILVDMGLGHIALPYLEIEQLAALDFLCALRAILADEVERPEPFQRVGPYWPFAF
jgi:hypothetical protein